MPVQAASPPLSACLKIAGTRLINSYEVGFQMDVTTTIIGAGAVGLAVAAELSKTRIEILSAKQIKAMEPHVHACAGLFSPSTGRIHSHRLMRHHAAQANKNGAQLVPQTTVSRVEGQDDTHYRVHMICPASRLTSWIRKWPGFAQTAKTRRPSQGFYHNGRIIQGISRRG